MNNIKIPSLNGDKIVEQYPLSIVAYKEWLGAFPNVEAAGLGKDGLIYENSLKAIFYFNPRSLYDFFDAVGLILEIGIFTVVNEGWYYCFLINEEIEGKNVRTRIEAEEAGFQKCFDLLEKMLNKQ